MVAVPPAVAPYRAPSARKAPKLLFTDLLVPVMVRTNEAREIPTGIIMATVAASETHMERHPVTSMKPNARR